MAKIGLEKERLQKVISRCGSRSRREAGEVILAGRVRVNGSIEKSPGKLVDPDRDHFKIDGKSVRPIVPGRKSKYFLHYKATGVVSTMDDPYERPCLGELARRLGQGVFPVGRLDFNSEGLIILTDDGEFANELAHPRFGCEKTYQVRVRGIPGEKKLDRIRGGMLLDGKKTNPARVVTKPGKAKNCWLEVTLTEGRRNQLRRMFKELGNPVVRLRRVAIGPIHARGLRPGGYRRLTVEEIQRVRRQSANHLKTKR